MAPSHAKRAATCLLALCLMGVVSAAGGPSVALSAWGLVEDTVPPETLPPETVPPGTVPPTRPTAMETIPSTSTPTPTPTPTNTPTPTPTNTPTNTPTPTPKPAYLPLLLKQSRKLLNGGFESGGFFPGWRDAGKLDRRVVSGPGRQRSGDYAALLGNPDYKSNGGCPTGEAAIHQVIDVPAKGHSALRLWYRIRSYDLVDFDYFAIDIAEWPSGPTEQHRYGCTNWTGNLWDSGWREAIVFLDNYRGRGILIKLSNAMTNEDGWYNTWTYIDDVSLENTS